MTSHYPPFLSPVHWLAGILTSTPICDWLEYFPLSWDWLAYWPPVHKLSGTLPPCECKCRCAVINTFLMLIRMLFQPLWTTTYLITHLPFLPAFTVASRYICVSAHQHLHHISFHPSLLHTSCLTTYTKPHIFSTCWKPCALITLTVTRTREEFALKWSNIILSIITKQTRSNITVNYNHKLYNLGWKHIYCHTYRA